jgi:hypothetical protein
MRPDWTLSGISRPGSRLAPVGLAAVAALAVAAPARATPFGRRGSRCKAALTRRSAARTLRLRSFERRRLRAGTRIVATVTNPGFLTQVKTLTMRKRRGPATRTQCETPATGGLASC